MPESAGRHWRGARFRRVHIACNNRDLKGFGMVVLVQHVRHQGPEAATKIAQPRDVLLELRDNDGHVIQHHLLDLVEIGVRQWCPRVEPEHPRADRAFQGLYLDGHRSPFSLNSANDDGSLTRPMPRASRPVAAHPLWLCNVRERQPEHLDAGIHKQTYLVLLPLDLASVNLTPSTRSAMRSAATRA